MASGGPRTPLSEFLVRIEDIRFRANVPAGMNVHLLMHLSYLLRCQNPEIPPVTVQQERDGTWRLMDGRHRFLAHLIAGRLEVPAVEEA